MFCCLCFLFNRIFTFKKQRKWCSSMSYQTGLCGNVAFLCLAGVWCSFTVQHFCSKQDQNLVFFPVCSSEVHRTQDLFSLSGFTFPVEVSACSHEGGAVGSMSLIRNSFNLVHSSAITAHGH